MTDLNVSAATDAWLGTQPAQAQMNLQNMQAQGIGLDNQIRGLALAQQKAFMDLQKQAMGVRQAAGPKAALQAQAFEPADIPGVVPQSFIEQKINDANLHRMAGMVPEADADMTMVGALLKDNDSLVQGHYKIAKAKYEQTTRDTNFIASVAPSIHSKADLVNALNQHQQMTGVPVDQKILQALQRIPDAQIPKLVEQMRLGAIAADKQANIEINKAREKIYAAKVASEISHSKKLEDPKFLEQRAEAEAKGRAKAGWFKVSEAEINDRTKLIDNQFPKMGDEEKRIAATMLADRANDLFKKNPAYKNKGEAEAAAFIAMKKEGVFKDEQARMNGSSADYPLDISTTDKPENGKFYTDGKQVLQWDANLLGGGQWKAVKQESKVDDSDSFDHSEEEED